MLPYSRTKAEILLKSYDMCTTRLLVTNQSLILIVIVKFIYINECIILDKQIKLVIVGFEKRAKSLKIHEVKGYFQWT